MKILVKIFSLLSLLLISCGTNSSVYKRIQGDALGTTYNVIVQSELNSGKIKQSIDSIFEVVNNSMSTYRTNSIISRVNLKIQLKLTITLLKFLENHKRYGNFLMDILILQLVLLLIYMEWVQILMYSQ